MFEFDDTLEDVWFLNPPAMPFEHIDDSPEKTLISDSLEYLGDGIWIIDVPHEVLVSVPVELSAV